MYTGGILAYIRAFAFLEKAEIQGDLETSPPTPESQGCSYNNLKDQPFQKSALEFLESKETKGERIQTSHFSFF